MLVEATDIQIQRDTFSHITERRNGIHEQIR